MMSAIITSIANEPALTGADDTPFAGACLVQDGAGFAGASLVNAFRGGLHPERERWERHRSKSQDDGPHDE